MSVTFTAELVPADGYVVTCGCEDADAQAPRFGTYDDACAAAEDADDGARTALPGCSMPDICPDYPLRAHPASNDPAPAVNVHDANARRLFGLLAFSPAPLGTAGAQQIGPAAEPLAPGPAGSGWASEDLPADAFLGRVLLALALTPDDAGTDGYGDGRFFTGGRSPGHLQRRLLELHELALWCRARGRLVVWH